MEYSRPLTAAYAAVQAVFWMSVCASVSFAAVYLQALGYTNTQLGAILAAGSLLGALLGPALSSLVDGSGRVSAARLLPPILAAQAAALALLLLSPVKGWVTTAAFTLYAAACLCANSPILKLYVDLTHSGKRLNFGAARAMGSLAYVLLSALLGVWIERTSVRVLPLVGLALVVLQFVFWTLLCREAPAKPEAARPAGGQGSDTAGFARQNPRFCVLLLGMVLLFFAHNTINNFFINIARAVGGDTGTMGWLNAFTAAVEIPVMLFLGRLRGNRSNAALLRLSFAFFTLKLFAVTLAPNIPALFAALLLQAPSFALYAAVIVDYTDEAVAFRDSAKAQSLAYSTTTLGSVLASVVSGRLLDLVSVRQTLLVAAVVCALGTAVAWAGLKERPAAKRQAETARDDGAAGAAAPDEAPR